MAGHEDDDMPDSVARSDDLAVTNQRVNQLDRSFRDLADDQQRMAKDLTTQINAVATTLSTKLENVVGQLNERNKIQWPAMSVALAFIVAIGGLVYWPIKDNQTRFETHLLNIAEKAVTQKELETRLGTAAQRRDDWQRASEDRSASNKKAIDELRENVVPRWMHDEKWRVSDQRLNGLDSDIERLRSSVVDRRELDERFNNVKREAGDLQRQIDKQDKAFGDTYSLRDVVNRLIARQDQLDREIRERGAAGGQK